MSTPVNPTRYCFFAAGDADFFRAVADAERRYLAGFLASSDWELSTESVQSVPALRSQPGAMNVGLGAVAVVGLFITTCFGRKIFDEVYNRTLKRPIAAFLDSIFSARTQQSSAPIQFQDVIHFEDINVVVVIQTDVRRSQVAPIQKVLPEAWIVAHDYIQRHGVKAPVHVHKIKAGQVSRQPELFESLHQARTPKRKQRAPKGKKDI